MSHNSQGVITDILENHVLSPNVEKFGYKILNVVLAFTKFESAISCDSVDIETNTTMDIPLAPSVPINFSPMPDSDESNVMVLCRICEEYVPLSLIEQHSQSCVIASQSEITILTTEDKIRKLQRGARSQYLQSTWPGDQSVSVNQLIPVSHMLLLLERAINLDTKQTSSLIELDMISHSLQQIFVSQDDPGMGQLVERAIQLVEEKMSSGSTLQKASILQQRTRASNSNVESPRGASHNTTIADFDFLQRISSGAHARVFLAKKKKTGDIFAIKVIPKSSLKQKNQVRRVLVEKDILLSLANPFMVNFYYSFIGNINLYLVMEFLPGGDLYSLLQKVGSLEEEHARVYSAQILAAVAYLHHQGIIHRDLKPDNILISSSGILKLTDFGLSYYGMVDRALFPEVGNIKSVEKIVEAKSLVGTPDYTPPEIILSQPHSFSADFWSLGIIIYEMVYGVTPFHGETEQEIFANVLKGQYTFYDSPEISKELKDLIAKLLNPNPEERLGSSDSYEILSHPWFESINFNDLTILEPPFIPDTSGGPSNEYFEERYSFQDKNDLDIMQEIQHAERQMFHSVSFDSDEEDEVSQNFPSVSFAQLSNSNTQIASIIRKKRNLSVGVQGEIPNISLQEATSKSFIIQNDQNVALTNHPHNRRHSFQD